MNMHRSFFSNGHVCTKVHNALQSVKKCLHLCSEPSIIVMLAEFPKQEVELTRYQTDDGNAIS